MSFTFCSSGAATFKAGANVSASVKANETMLASFSDGSEGMIEQETGMDFTTGYAGLSTSLKNALTDISSSLIGNKMVLASMGEYPSNRMSETLLDINDDIATKGINNIKKRGSDNLKTP